ncbi:MAG: FGGY family carbohydrate kinase [Candidatus Thermoplasmatota archaeon]|nr:FGGY family carbohydrate kinase [Candidatus Thermoplasmatota archaeon]
MKKYIMAIDEGTTGIRAIIFDHDTNVVSQSYKELTQIFPHLGWCEQSGDEIWKKCKEVMKDSLKKGKITADKIEAIGISSQRSTNLLWDKTNGKSVYNAITWHDTRTADLCKSMDNAGKMRAIRGIGKTAKALSKLVPGIRKTTPGARLITISEFSFPTVSSLAHTRWILDNVDKAKEVQKKENLLCGTMDTWLIWKLTNGKKHATDFSNASSTGMFDSFELKWSELFLDLFGVQADILPEILDTNSNFGCVDKKIIGKEIPIYSAVADQQSSLFASGCFKSGDVKCANGTGSFIDMNVGHKAPASLHKLLPLIAWRINGQTSYMLEGMINTTGSAIQWLKDSLDIIEKVEDTEKLAKSVKDTSGVYFVPAFTGLSSPYWDPHACGIVVGLNRQTGKEHIVRSALEGIVYRCKDVLNIMESDTNLKIASLKADGGASKNNFLLQFMADMLNITVERPKMLDGTALGAAYLAGLGCGFWETTDELISKRKIDKVFKPNLKDEERQRLYKGWKRAIDRSFMWK